MKYTVTHSNGLVEPYGSAWKALKDLKSVYGEGIVVAGDIEDDRILVWKNEAEADNDSGANAVASIREKP